LLEVFVAAKIFEVIAVVAIILFALVFAVALRFLAKFLKRHNKGMITRAGEVRKQFDASIGGVDNAQVQIEAMAAMSGAVRAGMESAIGVADTAVSFLESRTFQIGLPALLWFLLLAIALPRGLRVRRPPRREPNVIPPPSWEAAKDRAE
jgi:hypothetical protein